MKDVIKKVVKNPFALQKVTVVAQCIVCALFFTVSGCVGQKSDLQDESLKEESEILYGKWQLTTISPLNAEGVDYMLVNFSPMNIIYEFKANNVLIVSGDVDNNYGGLEIGKHFYEVTLTEIINNPLGLPTPHMVRINTIPYSFSFGYVSDSPGMVLVSRGECDSAFRFVKK